jgi:putative transposase
VACAASAPLWDCRAASYYHAAVPTASQREDAQIGSRIESIFKAHRRRYGCRRIASVLADEGTVCAPQRVRRLMRARGLRALQPRQFVPRTSDGRADAPSPNLLIEEPRPTLPDRVWADDITFIPTAKGWLYLAGIIDLYSHTIVGWALADHLRANLVAEARQQALDSRRPAVGLIFHSDRGSQYGSTLFRALLRRAGLRQSMSARANPYHKAWSQSFIGTLKTEMLQDGCFLNATDARIELFAFIESYYNTHREHSSLACLSPAQFETASSSAN